jgi:hypothetical protein
MRELHEYDVYFPLVATRGGEGATAVLARVKRELTEFFGGLTDFRHRSEGAWTMAGVTFRDEIVLLRVLGDDRALARSFLTELAAELRTSLDQEQILIVERNVVALDDPQ